MKDEQKIANMSALIKQLSEENEKLKDENTALKLTLELSEQNHSGSLSKAKDLIATCDTLMTEYNEAIVGAKEAKSKYEAATQELDALKNKYKKEMDKLIKRI